MEAARLVIEIIIAIALLYLAYISIVERWDKTHVYREDELNIKTEGILLTTEMTEEQKADMKEMDEAMYEWMLDKHLEKAIDQLKEDSDDK